MIACPIADDTELLSDVPTVSNVRHDLTEWQERHANLVLSTVKVLSFVLIPERQVIKILRVLGFLKNVNI